jgi:plastocyanin
MSNKTLSIIVVLVLIALGVFFFMGRTTAPTNLDFTDNTPEVTETQEENDTEENVTNSEVKEFAINAGNFAFSEKNITVKKGDRVRLVVTNTAGVHDLKLDKFNVATPILQVGQSQTVEFVADEAGTFEYYCSVGNHRAMGMVGTLVVEE